VLYAGGLVAHPHPLLVTELKALTLIRGKKLDHPPGGSKDVSDAWAGSVHGAVEVAALSWAGATPEVWHPDVSAGSFVDLPREFSEAPGSLLPSGAGNVMSALPADLERFSGAPFSS